MSKKNFLAIYAKSFNWAGAFLPKETYEDCSSLYNFCRSVDDIADCDDKLTAKVQKLKVFIDSFSAQNCDDEIIADMKRLIIKYNISDRIIFGLERAKFVNWSTVSLSINSDAKSKTEIPVLLSETTSLPPRLSSDIALSILIVKVILFI